MVASHVLVVSCVAPTDTDNESSACSANWTSNRSPQWQVHTPRVDASWRKSWYGYAHPGEGRHDLPYARSWPRERREAPEDCGYRWRLACASGAYSWFQDLVAAFVVLWAPTRIVDHHELVAAPSLVNRLLDQVALCMKATTTPSPWSIEVWNYAG
jgi:hypothetical protein